MRNRACSALRSTAVGGSGANSGPSRIVATTRSTVVEKSKNGEEMKAEEHVVRPRFKRYITKAEMIRQHKLLAQRYKTVHAMYTVEMTELYKAMGLDSYNHAKEFSHTTAGRAALDEASQAYREFIDAGTEYVLWQLGRPYYKIYPDFVTPMIETSLDIPCEHFRMPFAAWEIRLPEWAVPLDEHRYVMSILLADQMQTCVVDGCSQMHPLSRKFFGSAGGLADIVEQKLGIPCEHQGSNIHMKFQYFDPFADTGENIGTYSEQLRLDNRYSVGKMVKFDRSRAGFHVGDALPASAQSTLTEEKLNVVMDKIWSLVMTLSFLITGTDRIIEPDVLSKDLLKLRGADDEKALKLQAKASKRNKDGRGFTVGRGERIFGRAMQLRAEYGKTDRHLHHSHMRCGHLHGYHTNEGYIVKWVPPVVVRPDLKPNPHGRAGVQVRGA